MSAAEAAVIDASNPSRSEIQTAIPKLKMWGKQSDSGSSLWLLQQKRQLPNPVMLLYLTLYKPHPRSLSSLQNDILALTPNRRYRMLTEAGVFLRALSESFRVLEGASPAGIGL